METIIQEAATIHNTAIQKMLESQMKESIPKFDTIVTASVTYTDGGRWHNIEVTMKEYLQILQTGYVDDKQICAFELSTTHVDNEDKDTVRVIYDFVLLHTERNPFRMI